MATGEVQVTTAGPPAAAVPPQVEEKSVIPHPPPPQEKVDEPKAPAVVADKIPDPPAKRTSYGPTDRDVGLAQVEKEKSLSLIKAWEENEKTKVDNKAQNKLAAVASWENSKKADVEAKLKKLEEQLENKKAEYAEKMKNKVALVHKEAEEKRAMVQAIRAEELLKAEEMAAKHRVSGHVPKKALGWLGC